MCTLFYLLGALGAWISQEEAPLHRRLAMTLCWPMFVVGFIMDSGND